MNIEKLNRNSFEEIKHISDDGQEYWFARELAKILDYLAYRNFQSVIIKAKESCKSSGQKVLDHFVEVHNMVQIGSGTTRELDDVKLSRYACYLIVQNGDPRKEIIARGQTYFAIQACKQEFQDHGYKGLYDGLGAKDIHEKKKLKKSQHILDHMGSTELAANLFRATQTDEKLRRENIQGKFKANQTHYEVGKKVRETIQELGGTMPEKLPVPEKSLKQIEKASKKIK